ncbi:UDP-glucose--hexose-1-phosphate uridylyltransferase [Alkalihalobacillus sp. 1P02AB]|uniref:UDP-glucose--hexose-1-phosphate uridylyltransferase n=1 Tax=Alkalihalobacillus sp. 1P02AB TaxID=3132260 RepID=UPI0039A70BD2
MINEHIAGLIKKATEAGLIEHADQHYVLNQVIHQLGLEAFPASVTQPTDDTIPNLIEKLIDYAIEQNVIEDVFDDKEILAANIMNTFIARPSIINKTFYQKYEQSPVEATDYFYKLSQNSNYIQMNRIQKNISFKAETMYGELDITINLSKPEKDPEQIKRERLIKNTNHYPKCLLCKENEGYVGRTGYPARANHRIIQVPLEGEKWFLQYSPYVYYNEHSILLSAEHRDMKIDRSTFTRLLRFTEKFPHYFIGSNADLPIVGGSILSHDHYQAGHYEFAMTNAPEIDSFKVNAYPEIEAAILKWPLSVIRLKSKQLGKLVDCADNVLQTWKSYNDEQANILAFTNSTPHNTITPIARKRDDVYEIDLVLRNNRTTNEHPHGLFHPHEDVHHIKKENIGLIEVMGLAVLPPRLKDELEDIKKFLLNEANEVADYHRQWANDIKASHGTITSEQQAEAVVHQELGKKFVRVLEDAGVFKEQTSFKRFIDKLNK